MKKIYMLLTALLIGVAAASAAQPKVKTDYKPMYFTEEGAKLVKQIAHTRVDQADLSKLSIDPSHNIETTRGYYQQGNYLYRWTMSLDRDQRWCDLLYFINDEGEEDHYTFEEFPFYLVWFNMTLWDAHNYKEMAVIPQFGFWPCYYFFSQQFESLTEIPEEERNYDCVLPKDMCNPYEIVPGVKSCSKFQERPLVNGGLGVSPEIDTTTGTYAFWCIANQDFMISVTEADATVVYREFTGTLECTATRASNFTFTSLSENNNLTMNYTAFPLVYNSNGISQSYPIYARNFDGLAKINAFELKTIDYPIKKLHIFNAGEDSSAILGSLLDPYMVEKWGPLKRYFMYGFSNDLMDVVLESKDPKFDSDNLKVAFVDGVEENDMLNPDNLEYFFGSLFSDLSSEKPYDYWRVQSPTYKIDPEWGVQLTMHPEAHTCMPVYDLVPDDIAAAEKKDNLKHPDPDWTKRDAVVTYLEGNLVYMMPGSYIACGTPEGFVINGTDQYHNTVRGTFTDQIYYHGDPNDCMKYELISPVGTVGVNETVASNSIISGAQGQLLVLLEKSAPVAVYNLNGQQVFSGNATAGMPLNIELPGGFYVVKAGKETKKVVL